jgi:heterodisulfide reductase subunit A-like polyferredoxin
MSSAQSITAVVCSHRCSPGVALEERKLGQLVRGRGGIGELILLENPCGDAEGALKQLRGKKVLFAGCQYLEESGFYSKAAAKLGLGPEDFVTLDVKSGVFDLYEEPEGALANLAAKMASMAELLAARQPPPGPPPQAKGGVLIIGSGLSGLSVAAALAGDGLPLDLLETSDPALAPGSLGLSFLDAGAVQKLRQRVQAGEQVASLPASGLLQVEAVEAGFQVRLKNGPTREYGAVAFAPERVEARSEEVGAWNLSQLYERLLRGHPIKGRVVFLLDRKRETPPEIVQDVLLAARTIRERYAAEIWVLLRQVRVSLPGLQELYDSCREAGVIFVKYEALSLRNDYGDFELGGLDTQSGASFQILKPDRLVLPGRGMLSEQACALAARLGLRLHDGAYTQPDSLWRLPNESSRPGIFVAGSARADMGHAGIVSDAEALAYALRQRFLPHGVPLNQHVAVVDADKCAYCLTCVRVCPFGAMGKDVQQRVARPIAAACQGCGTCASECPAEAIELHNLTKQSIAAGLRALV